MGLTLVEKIAARYADPPGRVVRAGDFITIRPRHVMTHDNTAAVIPKFGEMVRGVAGAVRVHDPRQPVFAIDHDIQNTSPENLGKYAKIEKFAAEHGIDFYPAGTGISHQVMVEQGYVVPGSLVVGSDSHSNLYGALSALGTPVVRTDAASIWATGVTWWQVPPVARCELRGRLRPGVVGKDVIIALCGLFNKDEVLNAAVEFTGAGVAGLTMDQRMSIANMTTEWGALAGVFPFDETLRDWLLKRADSFAAGPRPGTRRAASLGTYTRSDVERWWSGRDALAPDQDAEYAVELTLDLSTVIPHVSGPNEVKVMHSLAEMERRRVPIQKAYLLSCVNARLEDLAEAAAVVRGRRVAPGVEFYLAAASAEVQKQAESLGYWRDLLEAGAIALPSGCGPCIGLGRGLVRAGENAISATNRNFKGRMGDPGGQVYLGSPAVVAASAVAGYICAPTRFDDARATITVTVNRPGARAAAGVEVIAGFPEVVRGRLLFMDKDNMNTDGIYAGRHTYNDAMTPGQMAAVAFENYDPAFAGLYRRGDIVASGFNFGTGSSREQAATALKHKGVPCVVAGSFSETYKRNAFNNGFVCFECPELIEFLRSRTAAPRSGEPDRPRTLVAGEAEIDYRRSVLTLVSPAGERREFPFPPLSLVAQELVVAGGAESVVRARLARRD